MAIATPDDVMTGVISRLKNATGYAQVIPGGIYQDQRPGNPKGYPYAVITIEEQAPSYVDSAGQLVDYLIEISLWVKSSDTQAAQTQPARQFLDKYLTWGPNSVSAGIEIPNSVKTIVQPDGGKLKLTASLRIRGQDVYSAGKKLKVTVQSTYAKVP